LVVLGFREGEYFFDAVVTCGDDTEFINFREWVRGDGGLHFLVELRETLKLFFVESVFVGFVQFHVEEFEDLDSQFGCFLLHLHICVHLLDAEHEVIAPNPSIYLSLVFWMFNQPNAEVLFIGLVLQSVEAEVC
jgi:hypothetical protein